MKRSVIFLFFIFIVLSCSKKAKEKNNSSEVHKLQIENDSLKAVINQHNSIMKNQIIRSLTFQDGNAENAMNFYMGIFDNSEIITIKRWGKGAPTDEGKIMQATFKLNGNLFMCSDSPPVHDWNFTPAVAHYIECDDEEEIEELFTKLSEKGKVMMPLNNYGFSQKFGFIEDQFGVSWQLNLE